MITSSDSDAGPGFSVACRLDRSPGLPAVVFVMGPTAVGKTDLAVQLVQEVVREAGQGPLFEIVSVDSAMVYRRLNIGTGKPGDDVLRVAPHRLIDIREPDQTYSAAAFATDARGSIEDIHQAGRIPLLVGGTGLYFKALRDGLAELPIGDPGLRSRLAAEAASDGWEKLHQRLSAIDPVAGQRIHPRDPQRIARALEVHELTGSTITALQTKGRAQALPNPIVTVILEPDERDRLHQRIGSRFDAMIRQGLIEEVAALRADRRLHRDLPSMRAVGYRQVWQHLDGCYDRDTMAERAIFATRQLAKRQMTWLRRISGAPRLRFDPSNVGSTTDRFRDYLCRTLGI